MPRITQQKLEAHLMGAANILRGRTAGQDYKTYILTLMFFKRLSDQWDYEAEEKIAELEAERGSVFTEDERTALMSSGNLHRFSIPDGCHWRDVLKVSENIGEVLTKATKGIATANPELVGVFTVDWNQPAPDGQGKLISNAVVHALVQHFNSVDLSNESVEPDILGRAYEYLIKYFADDAGAKAGEFFTPPEVVDILIRCLEPQPGETVYDPTCGSGGMLVHSADFLRENGHRPDQIRYYGQEMIWTTYAIARINMFLHGLEADIRGGKSTLTDPMFLKDDGRIQDFNVVIANFPFSDEVWWLPEDQRTEDQVKKAKKQRSKGGDKDPYARFTFGSPPASNGDFAFIQHIIASAKRDGRCGIVCPQGVLFRGQPEIEEETDQLDKNGKPKIRRRKADDEYLIRRGIMDAGMLDAVISLPLNIFYGAGLPACLLIIGKNRSEDRKRKVLMIYAARHYQELSAQNKLRPQDVMRILVHYHAYGDADKARELVEYHQGRLQTVVTENEESEAARITAEYEEWTTKLAESETEIAAVSARIAQESRKTEAAKLERDRVRLERQADRPRRKLEERDERILDVRKRAEEERQAVDAVGEELAALYADPVELERHARVVDFEEIEENEYNLNIPRYVDTFEPEGPMDVSEALAELDAAETDVRTATDALRKLLGQTGYAEKSAL